MPYPDELIEIYKDATNGKKIIGFITEEQLIKRANDPNFKALREKSKADYLQIEKRQKEVSRAQQIKPPGSSNGFFRFRNSLIDISDNPSSKEHNEMAMDMLNCPEGRNIMASKLLGSILNVDLYMAFPKDDFQALEYADRKMDVNMTLHNVVSLRDLIQNTDIKKWINENKTLLECFNRSNEIQKYYAKDACLLMDKYIPDIGEKIKDIQESINPKYDGQVSTVQDLSLTVSLKEREQINDFINNGGIDKNDFLFTRTYKIGENGEKTPMAKLDALKAAAGGDKSVSFEPMSIAERKELLEKLKNPMNLSKEQLENKTPDFTATTKDIYTKLRACEGIFRKNEPEFNEIKKLTQKYMKIKKPTAEQSYKFLRNVQQKAKQYVENRAEKVNDMNPTMKRYYDTLNNLSNNLMVEVGKASTANYQEKFNTKFIETAVSHSRAKKNDESRSAEQRKENEIHDRFMSFSEKVVSGKMPHCSNKNFQDLVFIGTSSTLSPIFENGETQKEGIKYKQDFANVLATEMILHERHELNSKEAMANPNAKLKVGPLEQMLNDSGAMAFTKAIAENIYVSGLLAHPKADKYFSQNGISEVKKGFYDYLKKGKNMDMLKSTITITSPNKNAKKEMAGIQAGAAH